MQSVLWSLEHVSLGADDRRRLDDVSVSILPGRTAVLGESGAGKTSLLNLLVEFDRPTRGTIQSHVGPNLSWVPPDHGLWPRSTVRQHLEAVCPGAVDANSSVDHWLKSFALESVAKRYPSTLSMGERSRLAVARSLASQAVAYVMDEPLANVDSARLPEFWSVLRESLQQTESSLVFATHSAETVLAEADQVICLDGGRLVWQGAVRELYDSPPDERTARFLGPVNWFEGIEAATWLEGLPPQKTCYRPEQLAVLPDESGKAVVEEVRFAGSLEEVRLGSMDNSLQKTVYHRPAAPKLSPGMAVSLRALLVALLMCCVAVTPGCQKSNAESAVIPVEKARHYQLPPEGVMLPAPRGMTFGPDEELFVLDNAGRMVVYDKQGELLRQWWMPEYDVGKPEGAWVLHDGRVAVADTHYHRVLFFSQKGDLLGSIGERGEGPGQFIYTVAVTQDPNGFLYVAEYGGNDRVQKFTAEGEFVLSFGKAGTAPGEFQRASGVVWKEGIVYVADAINSRVQAFTDSGEFLRVVADAQTSGLHYPYDVSLGPDDCLYVAEYGAGRVTRLTLSGDLRGRYGDQGRGLGDLYGPWGIAVSRSGKVAVADTGNRRVVELQL